METPRKRKDDLHYRIVSKYLGLKLHEIILTKDEVLKNLERVLYQVKVLNGKYLKCSTNILIKRNQKTRFQGCVWW